MRRTEYRYQVGEVVNDTLKIMRQTGKGKNNAKAYEVQSLFYLDAPRIIISEYDLNRGYKDPYKTNRRIFEGNSLWSVAELRKYIIDEEQAKTIAPNHSKKIRVKCPTCDTEKLITPNKMMQRKNISCRLCSKGTSYPELFMMAYLEVKEIKYEYQKVFDDLPNRRFDFYIKDFGILEVNGEQHYKEPNRNSTWAESYNKTKSSDREKYKYCYDKNINIVSIDCSRSSYEYIRNNINKIIGLPKIRSNEKIKILEIINNNKQYPVKEIIYSFKKGVSFRKMSYVFNISEDTIRNVLKRFDVTSRKIGRQKGAIPINKKKVKCLTTNNIFESLTEAGSTFNVQPGDITRVCKGKRNYAGKHPVTGEKLQWEYVD